MPPMIPPVVVQVLNAVELAPVPLLVPIIESLKICIELYNGVKTNRLNCESLLIRSADLVTRVNDLIKERSGDEKKRSDPVEEGVQEVARALDKVINTFHLASSHSVLYWLFHQDDLAGSFADAHKEIEDAFRIFSMKADIAIYHQLQENHQEVIEGLTQLKVPSTPTNSRDRELRSALARLLAQTTNSDDKSAASDSLQTALVTLLGSNAANDLPPYVTTSYEIVKDVEVKRGPYSIVWKGRWQNCSVAIKEVPITQQVTRLDLERQVGVWSGLRHENILQFYAVSASSDVPFLVSPFLEHGNIMDYILKNEECDRVRFVRGIASGMQYLHSRNFVHGNLQGENVLVNASLVPCISGFGMSKIKHDELSQSNDEAFKKRNSEALRPWMAPERFMGKLTKPTDVWAFGMTAHEILSGRRPFDDMDPQAIRKHVMASKAMPIVACLGRPTDSDVRHGYTPAMRKLIERTLVFDRLGRPQFNAVLDMLVFITASE